MNRRDGSPDVAWTSKDGRVAVRYMGQIEVGTATPRKLRPGYRWTNGYSVVVDGREGAPWMRRREAMAMARQVAADLAKPRKL